MNENEIIQNISQNGIAKVENFLDQENLLIVEKILKEQKNIKGSQNAFFFRSKGHFLLKKILKLKIFNLIECLKIINISKKLKLNELSNKIHGNKTKLFNVDSYYSKKSNDKILDWHVDQAYSGNPNPRKFLNPDHGIVKFFVYLTDVSYNNGCLGYIPGSNKILYYLKLGIFKKEIKYKPYWQLNDLRSLLNEKEYKDYLISKLDSKSVEKFLDQTYFITTKHRDTNDYDFELKKGDALIFDDAGVHRGAEPKKNDRLVLRFSFRDKNYSENQ